MRIANLLHFTEHHRYSVYRDFALSALQSSMLTHMYQPIVGLSAVGLYHTLYRQVAEAQSGYSPLELHRRLLLLTGSEGEAGRATGSSTRRGSRRSGCCRRRAIT
ncbi:hypothetical protein [Gordoniibacillus kamchatkensis]|uniref:hypothetical protein n=1 Tax=Gordoniibacillus kamchatkensis TaxID=1590651 RepID=UPI000A8E3AD4|nr:hypothetical protein [Paenibacillus sp. VKM B-2647]